VSERHRAKSERAMASEERRQQVKNSDSVRRIDGVQGMTTRRLTSRRPLPPRRRITLIRPPVTELCRTTAMTRVVIKRSRRFVVKAWEKGDGFLSETASLRTFWIGRSGKVFFFSETNSSRKKYKFLLRPTKFVLSVSVRGPYGLPTQRRPLRDT